MIGWYVAPYLPYFNPNRNYIGAVILAVHDGKRWYHDGRKDKWQREARNHWDGRSIVTGKSMSSCSNLAFLMKTSSIEKAKLPTEFISFTVFPIVSHTV